MKNTKQLILDTAIKMFSENSFNKISIMDICEKCSITKGTFYYHYNSKNELLLAYYESLLINTISITKDLIAFDSPYEQLWRLLESVIDNEISMGCDLLKHLIIIDIERECGLFTPYAALRKKRSVEYIDLVKSIIIKGQEAGEIRNNIKPRELYFAFIAAAQTVIINWASTNGRLPIKNELKQLFDTIFSC
ncbi:MAG TPA: TetR/AcrR family transcriptional regulator [Clostridia bacterium]|nr:TetR/AcrR family transcriptional regulator [Clostridia bacterium]